MSHPIFCERGAMVDTVSQVLRKLACFLSYVVPCICPPETKREAQISAKRQNSHWTSSFSAVGLSLTSLVSAFPLGFG